MFKRYLDFRALKRLFYYVPLNHARKIRQYVNDVLRRNRQRYPLKLIFCEMAGFYAGPAALWKSRRRVKVLGRSEPINKRGLENKNLQIDHEH
jgi:hypothetical protein